MVCEVVHPEEVALWESVAAALAPRVRVRPSLWATENLRLSAKLTPHPGAFNVRFKPWTGAIMDACYEEPEKKGIIGMKPSQVGWSYSMIALMLYLVANAPGPILYVTSTKDEAKKFDHTVMGGMIRDNPELAAMFPEDADNRQLVGHREYSGGAIDCVGANTESGVLSHARKYVFLDEYQLASASFPKDSGDLFVTALGRIDVYKDTALMFVYGHPRYENEDVHKLNAARSDQREWVFDCPHCGETVWPRFELIEFRMVKEADAAGESVIDPDSAALVCAGCRKDITDAERARAVWPQSMGGTGRLQSAIEDEAERGRREYIGISINGLADPDRTVREIAGVYAGSGSTEALQSFFNKKMGQTYRQAGMVLTEDIIKQRVEEAGRAIVVPGGPLGAHFVTVGVDVQAPEHNPILYAVAVAWCGSGAALIIDVQRMQGWALLHQYLRTLSVRRDLSGIPGQAAGASDTLYPAYCGVDCGSWTGHVLDASRVLVTAANGARVQMVPVRYQSFMKSTTPAMIFHDRKRVNPLKPHLGMIEAYELHRDTWVDRTMRRWIDGRVRMLCAMPDDWAAHVTAQVLAPKRDLHGWGSGEEMVWVRQKGRRDDWARAQDYAEVVAAVKCNLDSIYEMAAAPIVGPSAPEMAERGGGEREGRGGRGGGGGGGGWLGGGGAGWFA